jgi:hypothetical protein
MCARGQLRLSREKKRDFFFFAVKSSALAWFAVCTGASEFITCNRLQWHLMYQNHQITVRLVEVFKLRCLRCNPATDHPPTR